MREKFEHHNAACENEDDRHQVEEVMKLLEKILHEQKKQNEMIKRLQK